MEQVNWMNSLDQGLSRARAERKLVFVDFFNPN